MVLLLRKVLIVKFNMPIYEFRCLSCNNEFEFFINYKDLDKTKYCPKCNSINIKRLISKSSFVLKGPCWARDGYK